MNIMTFDDDKKVDNNNNLCLHEKKPEKGIIFFHSTTWKPEKFIYLFIVFFLGR